MSVSVVAAVLGAAALAGPLVTVASADDATPITAVFARTADTTVYHDTDQPGTSVHVVGGVTTDGSSDGTFYLHSVTSGADDVEIRLSRDLAPGTYATSRIPGDADAVLDPGALRACGNDEPGSLTVSRATYDDAGLPTTYSASFSVAACPGEAGGDLTGALRLDSSEPLAATTSTTATPSAPVEVGSHADVPVVVTAVGNTPVALGTASLVDGTTDSTGRPYWSVVGDACSGTTVDPGSSCTVLLRVEPIRPNGYPRGTVRAAVSIPDPTGTALYARAEATVTPMRGQPLALRVSDQFRQLHFEWSPPGAVPADWKAGDPYVYSVWRVDGGTRTLVGTTGVTRVGVPGSLFATGLVDGTHGTYVVTARQQGTTDGPDSLPVDAAVVRSEVLIPDASAGVVGRPLDPAGPDHPLHTVFGDLAGADLASVTVSRDQSVVAFTAPDASFATADQTVPSASARTVATAGLDGGTTRTFVSKGKPGTDRDLQPSLSPDGTRVVYVHSAGGVSTLRLGDTRTGGVRDVPGTAGLSQPTFSADGGALVAVRFGTGSDIGVGTLVLVNPATGTVTAVRNGAGLSQPDVAADGRIVAVERASGASAGTGLVVLSPSGARTPVTGATDPADSRPRFSADGRTVYFTHTGSGGGGSAARTVDLASGAVTSYDDSTLTAEATPFVLHQDTADVTPPRVSLTSPTAAVTLGSALTLFWTVTDPAVIGATTSGPATVDVRYRAAVNGGNLGSYQTAAGLTGVHGLAASVPMRAGTEYCFSARARDAAGNTSGWGGERCTSTPIDDRAFATAASRRTGSAFYLHTFSKAAKAGTTFTRTGVVASRVGVVATTCPTCGAVDVYLNRRYLGRVSLRTSATRYEQVLWLRPQLAAGSLLLRTVNATQVLMDGVVTVR